MLLVINLVEDLERNDGSVEKPYYMNKELKEILGKKNDKPPTDNEKTSKVHINRYSV